MTATTTDFEQVFRLATRPDAPTELRATVLHALAVSIADVTNATETVQLAGIDRLQVAMLLPNLNDRDAQTWLLRTIGEEHAATYAEEIDPRDPDWRDPDDYRDSARWVARQAVDADILAGVR